MSDTIDIKVLGTRTSGHQTTVAVIKKYLDAASLDYELSEIDDVSTFLKMGLESVPSVSFNGRILPIKLNGAFNKSLRQAIKAILSTYNYGDMDSILVPVDFSEVSTNAFAYGHRLASQRGAMIRGLNVYYPSSTILRDNPNPDHDISKDREDELEAFLSKFDQDWGSDLLKTALIDCEFRVGFPADEILQSERENHTDLIVMGTTGSSKAKSLFGSVSTKVLNDSTKPVLLVPKSARYTGVKHIMYAFETVKPDIIQQLIDFNKDIKARIHLLHIAENNTLEEFNTLIEAYNYDNQEVTIDIQQLSQDNIEDQIHDYALQHSIDMIVMDTHHKSMMDRLFDDNITVQMAGITSLPLLVLKSE